MYCPICLDRIITDIEEHSPLLKKATSESEPTTTISPVKTLPNRETEQVEASPIIGILCGHFFHMSCLEKW